MEPEVKRFPVAVNPYGYKLPVQYEIAGLASGTHFLKVVFRTEAQVSRVELRDAR